MPIYSSKAEAEKNKSVADTNVQQPPDFAPTVQIKDNRPQAIAQRKLQLLVNDHINQQLQPLQKKENGLSIISSNSVLQLAYSDSADLPDADVRALNLRRVAVGAKMGNGGFGGVWKGTYQGRDVAIKGFDEGAGAATHEYQMMQAAPVGTTAAPILKHGKLVVMELIAGTPVNKLQTGNVPEAMIIVGQVMLQLIDLHDAGMAHGDIKTKNLIQDPQGDTRLIDFGKTERINQGDTEKNEASYGGDLRMLGRLLKKLIPAIDTIWDDDKEDHVEPSDLSPELTEILELADLLMSQDNTLGKGELRIVIPKMIDVIDTVIDNLEELL